MIKRYFVFLLLLLLSRSGRSRTRRRRRHKTMHARARESKPSKNPRRNCRFRGRGRASTRTRAPGRNAKPGRRWAVLLFFAGFGRQCRAHRVRKFATNHSPNIVPLRSKVRIAVARAACCRSTGPWFASAPLTNWRRSKCAKRDDQTFSTVARSSVSVLRGLSVALLAKEPALEIKTTTLTFQE